MFRSRTSTTKNDQDKMEWKKNNVEEEEEQEGESGFEEEEAGNRRSERSKIYFDSDNDGERKGDNVKASTSSLEMGWKAAEKLIRHWKVLRGDNVMIIRGKDRGETGVIKRVIRSQNRVIVEGKNLVKKHIKQGQGHEGGIFTVEAPLHASNVQVIDPVTGKPCKVGVKYLEDGTKVRVSRGLGASGSIIPRPEILKIRTTPRPTVAGPKDTPMDVVLEKTYDAKTGMGMPDL
ncbi:hypothetical protein FNV43_RR00620 [Rhamnella rubrinervis]|uniref:KOW domain-containing protein n=1 Tax=Rhamnella rubrinervis TaxID=2594499 RepID=A0A8K0MRK3_9ROSA|nr:hypothetical protein FNV43_RR00620 [Rhamnella rubrinervis]